MDANEKTLTAFTTRVRQMILQYSDLKKENSELYAMVDERDAQIKDLQKKLEQADREYQLLKMAKMLVERDHSSVPSQFDELMKLPGVGRKTANVILSVVFNKAAMAVDTHVFRVSNRIGLTNNSPTPLATEKTLVKYIPGELQPIAHHWLILHGRYVCTARNPKCAQCGIADLCKDFEKRNPSLTSQH